MSLTNINRIDSFLNCPTPEVQGNVRIMGVSVSVEQVGTGGYHVGFMSLVSSFLSGLPQVVGCITCRKPLLLLKYATYMLLKESCYILDPLSPIMSNPYLEKGTSSEVHALLHES